MDIFSQILAFLGSNGDYFLAICNIFWALFDIKVFLGDFLVFSTIFENVHLVTLDTGDGRT